jgi:hypothetical protein
VFGLCASLVHPTHPAAMSGARRDRAPFSPISAIKASVVSISAAIHAAFCNPRRVTLAGSMIPALSGSVNSPDSALKPKLSSFDSADATDD